MERDHHQQQGMYQGVVPSSPNSATWAAAMQENKGGRDRRPSEPAGKGVNEEGGLVGDTLALGGGAAVRARLLKLACQQVTNKAKWCVD